MHDENNDIRLFGLDYNAMMAQQYALGAYVNLMSASTQLLVNPILGLLPQYAELDLEKFMSQIDDESKASNMVFRIQASGCIFGELPV